MNIKKYKFSNSVINELKYYVYIYSDLRINKIFYVGKGKGNRIFSHLEDTTENEKVQYLNKLKALNIEPKIEILIHGLEDDKTALRVESSIIDLLQLNNLTNIKSGYKSALYGRMSIDQINSAYNKEEVKITDPTIMIRINQAFSYSMSPVELYDYTRGHWRIKKERAEKAKYVFAVYEGIVQEVYQAVSWFKACTTYSSRQGNERIKRKPNDKLDGRIEFVGNIAEDQIRNKYRYKSVEKYFRKGNSNPIMYVNV